jgi:hypothetical protein
VCPIVVCGGVPCVPMLSKLALDPTVVVGPAEDAD